MCKFIPFFIINCQSFPNCLVENFLMKKREYFMWLLSGWRSMNEILRGSSKNDVNLKLRFFGLQFNFFFMRKFYNTVKKIFNGLNKWIKPLLLKQLYINKFIIDQKVVENNRFLMKCQSMVKCKFVSRLLSK